MTLPTTSLRLLTMRSAITTEFAAANKDMRNTPSKWMVDLPALSF
jgi:hypothetical protein